MSDIDSTLKERGSRYNLNGEYKDHARLTQSMKECCRKHKGWTTCPPDMQEAIDMILHKIARVINGDPYYIDNWVDIEGYSRLVSRKLGSPKGDSTLDTTSASADPIAVVTALYNPLPTITPPDDEPHVVWPHDNSTDLWVRGGPVAGPLSSPVKAPVVDT